MKSINWNRFFSFWPTYIVLMSLQAKNGITDLSKNIVFLYTKLKSKIDLIDDLKCWNRWLKSETTFSFAGFLFTAFQPTFIFSILFQSQ